MATNENNIQINTFTEGMNMDQAFDSVKTSQYRYALNARMNNIIAESSSDPSVKSGILSPLYMYKNLLLNGDLLFTKNDDELNITDFHVYKTLLSGDYVIVLYSNKDSKINVGRITEDSDTKGAYKFNKICSLKFSQVLYKNPNISAVLHYEQDTVVNLYIADANGKIILINIADQTYLDKLKDDDGLIDVSLLRQNNYFPSNKVTILGTTSGQLKTSQVLYTYRFYKKHGNCSKLAPLTNKILIINSSRDSEIGNAEDTITSIGLKLRISDTNIKLFDSIQIYRLLYIKAGLNAETSLIYDGLVTKINDNIDFTYIDDGKDSLQDLSMEEFSGLDGLSIIPEVIEQNQNYLFAGNVKDETIILIEPDYQNNKNIEKIVVDDKQILVPEYLFTTYSFYDIDNENNELSILYISEGTTKEYIADSSSIIAPWYLLFASQLNSKDIELLQYGYSDPYSDINCKYDVNIITPTDRKYHIGGEGPCIGWNLIIYNDKAKTGKPDKYYIKVEKGTYILDKSPEFTTSDIYTDYLHLQRLYSSVLFSYNDLFTSSALRSLKRNEVYRYGIVFFDENGNRTNVLWIADIKVPSMLNIPLIDNGHANIIGVEFCINKDKLRNLEEYYNIVGYEIVRCAKPDAYSRCLDLVATSTVVRQHLTRINDYSPYYPTGIITSLPQQIVYTPCAGETGFPKNMTFAESPTEGDILLLIYSPQIQIQRKDYLLKLKSNQCNLHIVNYTYTNDAQWLAPSAEQYTEKNIIDYIDNDSAYSDYSKTNLKRGIGVTLGPLSYYHNGMYINDNFAGGGTSVYYNKSNYGAWLYFDTHYLDLKIDTKITSSYLCNYDECTDELCTINTDNWADNEGITVNTLNVRSVSLEDVNYTIKNVIDVKDITWENGFSNHTYDGSNIKNAVKKYKSYISTIGNSQYVNWICSNKYNLPIGTNEEYGWTKEALVYDWSDPTEFTNADGGSNAKHTTRDYVAIGPIGPGGLCFIINIPVSSANYLFTRVLFPKTDVNDIKKYYESNEIPAVDLSIYQPFLNVGTIICDITHTALLFAGTSKEEHNQDIYYGFGNYYKLHPDAKIDLSTTVNVFDGDTYINDCEFVGMFKAYDFNDDKSSLLSLLTVFRIPMESKINQMFDYGLNYRNTNNPNLQLLPGTISNITSQERALNQYNLIYSDNNTSNNMYNVDNSRNIENKFEQRVFYSQLKTNGENIDNWLIFKAANFIDVNSRYGILTDMLTVDDLLYFWQQYAFGKFSVNERSLVKDENSNTILLGQGDVLLRCDYVSTDYGMRKYDMCKAAVDLSVFWYDNYNNCIVKYGSSGLYYKQIGCINYSEQKLVRSCFRDSKQYYDDVIPTLTYNKDYLELIFSPVIEPDYSARMLVFNTKYDIVTSFYQFDSNSIEDTLYQYKKDCFYLQKEPDDMSINIYTFQGENSIGLLNIVPVKFEFVINKAPSTTKVFDNLQIVLGTLFLYTNPINTSTKLFKNTEITFSTDLDEANILAGSEYIATNREGNICYPIPRSTTNDISRIRGKWMKELVTNNTGDFAISHIITKFRQSYS